MTAPPRSYPLEDGYRLATRPYPFGADGRELEWRVIHSDRVFDSGEAIDLEDARQQALRSIRHARALHSGYAPGRKSSSAITMRGLTARDVRRRGGTTLSRQKQEWISEKIRTLRHEGYPQQQAIAIAYRMAGVPARTARAKRDPGCGCGDPPSNKRSHSASASASLRSKRQRQTHEYEGVVYYPYSLTFTTEDRKQHRILLHVPGDWLVRETFDRYVDANDLRIKRGSNVIVRRLPTDQRDATESKSRRLR